ncbi:MAG TPA: glycoside hydrolase, partial [Mariniflexile sp.]
TPMVWKNNWPVMGKDLDGNGIGEPILTYKKPVQGMPIASPKESDEFNDGKPGLQWQWYANASVKWSAQIPGTDYLRLFAISKKEEPNLWNVPNLLLQKLPAPNFKTITKVTLTTEWDTPGKTVGLIMMGQSYAYIGIAYHDEKYWVQQIICNKAIEGRKEQVIDEKELKSNTVFLSMKVSAPNANCVFSYSEDGKTFKELGTGFIAEKDLWISAKMGVFCVSEKDVRMGGYADFDWFKVDKI